jgi:RHS repeat-associated protein
MRHRITKNGPRRTAAWGRRLSVLLLAVPACGTGGKSQGSADPFAREQEILAASMSLSQALAGKVNAVPGVSANGTIAAAVTAQEEVLDSGAASYRVPLWMPDGIAGLKPELALEYQSDSERGLLGPKWRLDGLSSITRCHQTIAQDSQQRPVDIVNGDVFCLDGERLLRTTGSPKGTGEFRTESNAFRRVVATTSTVDNITSFKVYQPDGRIFYYGRTESSRLGANATSKSYYHTYYVDRIDDHYGNSILISYRNDFVYAAGSKKVQEKFPDTISWGSTGDTAGRRSVKFVYEMTNQYTPAKVTRYVSSYQIVNRPLLTGLDISGPTGSTTTAVLKHYKFAYTTPSITGEKLLQSISECDASNVCKRPTTITWESGSLTYTGQSVKAGGQLVRDVAISSGLPIIAGDFGTFDLSNVYRRLLIVDLNDDGKDDIVYRQLVSAPGTATGNRIAWKWRMNSTTGTAVTFGAANDLPGDFYADPTPTSPRTGVAAQTSDVIFHDLNRDDYPDVIIPKVDTNGGTTINGYGYAMAECPVPGGLSACFSFGPANDLIVPGENRMTAGISIGDVTGDSFPEVIRGTGSSLVYSGLFPATTGAVPLPAVNMAGFQLFDLDGDGTSEAVLDWWDAGGAWHPWAWSPTMSGQFTGGIPISHMHARWQLDLNGDGLMDMVTLFGTELETWLNVGDGTFVQSNITNLPAGYTIGLSYRTFHPVEYEPGVRIADFNLDGRQDLVLVDAGQTSTQASTRTTVKVLLSDGLGGFTTQDTNIPIGDYADGPVAFRGDCAAGNCGVKGPHGYRTTAIADINGDGQPDLVQLQGGVLTAYVRQGNKPDMVKNISEGTGHCIDFLYGPASDPSVHVADPQTCYGHDGQHELTCLTRNRWLTKQMTVTSLERPGLTVTATTRYSYKGGLFERFGRGFLGFERREIFGPNSRHTTLTYDPLHTATIPGASLPPHLHTWAFLPQTVTIDTDTSQGPNAHHREVQTYSYTDAWGVGDSRFFVRPLGIVSQHYDCPGDGAGGCNGALRLLEWHEEALKYWDTTPASPLGKVIGRTLTERGADGNVLAQTTESMTYEPFNANDWMMRLMQVRTTSISNTVTPQENVVRLRAYTPDPRRTNTGMLTNDVSRIEIEPSGPSDVYRRTDVVHDLRGRVQLVQESDGSGSPPRTTTYTYDSADGVYEATATNALNQKTSFWRHPGFGFLVEVDEPNGLASTTSYDTFGRPQLQTGFEGAVTGYSYADASDPVVAGGVDMTVKPENKTTRQRTVHADSLGRLTAVTTPVDASHGAEVDFEYDGVGRLTKQVVRTGASGVINTVRNTYLYTYDDLNRQTSDCHTAADGTQQCSTRSFDGLTTTSTNESGRVTTKTYDPVGRLSSQKASGPAVMGSMGSSGPADALYSYGAFSLLKQERLADGSSQTDIVRDVEGRQTWLTRTGAGTQGTVYNGLGEVMSTSKLGSDQTLKEVVSYTHDALGRVTSITGSGINRTFSWDAPASAPGTPAPNAIGKLVDMVVVENGGSTQVHFDYDPNGLVTQQTWSATVFGPRSAIGVAGFKYDSTGRLWQLTYPATGAWGNPLVVQYTYDDYNGNVKSMADASNPSVPLWQVTTRDELGDVSTETLAFPQGPTLSRATSYNLQNGLVKSASLSGTNGEVRFDYGYHADGLVKSLAASGVGGSYTSTFDYDSLSRLTHWGTGASNVDYAYDSDGNLIRRGWTSMFASETALYGTQPTSGGYLRTIATNSSDTPSFTDQYSADLWGRVYDTPAAALSYNALDEVASVTEKTSGRTYVMRHDANGKRMASVYGDMTSGLPYEALYTLGDLYEFHNVSGTWEERNRLSVDGKLIGELVRTSNTGPRAGTLYLTDNVGSVLAEASSEGAVSLRARRDPFGNLTDPSGQRATLAREPNGPDADTSSRLGFGGNERDTKWGIVDMDTRFYSPRLGRFISPDPLVAHPFDRRDYNPFAYAWNNPTNLNDPTGRSLGGGYDGAPPSGGSGMSDFSQDPGVQTGNMDGASGFDTMNGQLGAGVLVAEAGGSSPSRPTAPTPPPNDNRPHVIVYCPPCERPAPAPAPTQAAPTPAPQPGGGGPSEQDRAVAREVAKIRALGSVDGHSGNSDSSHDGTGGFGGGTSSDVLSLSDTTHNTIEGTGVAFEVVGKAGGSKEMEKLGSRAGTAITILDTFVALQHIVNGLALSREAQMSSAEAWSEIAEGLGGLSGTAAQSLTGPVGGLVVGRAAEAAVTKAINAWGSVAHGLGETLGDPMLIQVTGGEAH